MEWTYRGFIGTDGRRWVIAERGDHAAWAEIVVATVTWEVIAYCAQLAHDYAISTSGQRWPS